MFKKIAIFASLGIAALLVVVALIVWFVSIDTGTYEIPENPIVVKSYGSAEDYTTEQVDSLNELYGKRKNLPKGYEIQALLALSHYPELKDVRVDFVLRKSNFPMQSLPRIKSMLRRKKKWVYRVLISTEGSNTHFDFVRLKNLPFDAQIAILGHELCHAVYYQNMNAFQMIKYAVCYSNSKFKNKNEQGTDIGLIRHGLGWQLLTYSKHVRTPKERFYPDYAFVDESYLNPDRVAEEMRKLGMYTMGE